jgi:hypothetical protein
MAKSVMKDSAPSASPRAVAGSVPSADWRPFAFDGRLFKELCTVEKQAGVKLSKTATEFCSEQPIIVTVVMRKKRHYVVIIEQ